VTEGKFFRIGSRSFILGADLRPLQARFGGWHLPKPEQVERDFALMKELNANCLRVYHVPPRLVSRPRPTAWIESACGLLLAEAHLLPGRSRDDPVRANATRTRPKRWRVIPPCSPSHLANEIPPDIARWYGAKRIAHFIDGLAAIVKEVGPATARDLRQFPTTEFLQPASLRFSSSFNVYLHDAPLLRTTSTAYRISRRQTAAAGRFGIDSNAGRRGKKAQILGGHIEIAFRAGLAGIFLFAFTDDWHTGGHQIENWVFRADHAGPQTARAFHAVAEQL